MVQLLDSLASSANLLWIILLIAGFFLMVVEMYVPGFGVPGISGLFCLIISIWFLSNGSVVTGLILTVIVVALLCVALSISIRSASKGRLGKSAFALKEVSVNNEERSGDLNYYVGKVGTAKTILRPAGVGDFDGVRLNVLTDGEFVAEGAAIVVTNVEGNRIFVKESR